MSERPERREKRFVACHLEDIERIPLSIQLWWFHLHVQLSELVSNELARHSFVPTQ